MFYDACFGQRLTQIRSRLLAIRAYVVLDPFDAIDNLSEKAAMPWSERYHL